MMCVCHTTIWKYKFNHMMKKVYQIPLLEVISFYEIMDPVCGISGGSYTGEEGGYDDDSD